MASRAHLDFHGRTLKNREVAGFALREILHQPGVFIPKHSHEPAFVTLILNGAATQTFDRRALEYEPLSVSYVSPGLTHTDDFRYGTQSLVFEIAHQKLHQVQELLTMKEPIFVNGGPAAWLALRMYDELRRTDEASSLAIEGLALEILAGLSRLQMAFAGDRQPRWLQTTRDLLHDKFAETLTHDELGRSVGVHPVHLATVFRKHFDCTIGEYVRRLRIDFASRQLARSEDSLCEIALAAGFSDQSHFSKVFKNQTGMTPGHFRASLRSS
jgi:AraC family transcriptional regulator